MAILNFAIRGVSSPFFLARAEPSLFFFEPSEPRALKFLLRAISGQKSYQIEPNSSLVIVEFLKNNLGFSKKFVNNIVKNINNVNIVNTVTLLTYVNIF